MKKYKINSGTITLKLIPNYNLDNNTEVVALVRNIESNNYNELLLTYYDEHSNLTGLSYSKTYKDNTKILFNIRNDNNGISYEYQYIAYDNGYYNITGSYQEDGRDRSVIIKKDNKERLFRKYLGEDGTINYIFSDGKENNSDSYNLIINYNEKEKESLYSYHGANYYFEFSEIREDDCILENFYNDNDLILMYDGNNVYRGYYKTNEEEIDPDKELESIINGEEFLDEEETEYEEIELDSKYYKNNGHGPIYNKEVSRYIDDIDFYISGLTNNFPKVSNSLFSKDKEYIEEIKEIHPDIDLNRLILNINTNNFIDSSLNSIKVRTREK